MLEFNLKVQVEDEYLDDIIDIAREGGINYWAEEVIVVTPMVESNGEMFIMDIEGEGHEITRKELIKAIQIFINDNPTLDPLNDPDAGIADSIVQIATFGEIIYG